jgi:hypothetical protein
MRKRVFIAILAAAALLVAPVAGTDAKPDGVGGGKLDGVGGGKLDGVGGPTGSKKCEKPRSVGFKVNGTFGGFDGTGLSGDLTVNVVNANRHARDWLAVNPATFPLDGDENVKFIGLVGFEDAVATDVVKLKAKLELPKHGCPVLPEDDAVPVEDAVTEVGAEDAQLEASTDLEVTKVKVKRPNANDTDETDTVETD